MYNCSCCLALNVMCVSIIFVLLYVKYAKTNPIFLSMAAWKLRKFVISYFSYVYMSMMIWCIVSSKDSNQFVQV